MAGSKVQEVMTVRQEVRKPVKDLTAGSVERRHLLRYSSPCCNPMKRADGPWTEYDNSLAIPGASSSQNDIRYVAAWSAAGLDDLQLRRREESNRPAVRRPERQRGIVRSRQEFGIYRIQI